MSSPRPRTSPRRRPDAPLSARGKARKRALDVLYEADLRGSDPVRTLAERLAQSDPPVPEYAVELVEGVTAHRAELDGEAQRRGRAPAAADLLAVGRVQGEVAAQGGRIEGRR